MRQAVRALTLLLAGLWVSGAAALEWDQAVFEARLGSFLAGGYDPLTAPVDWYDTTPVAGDFAGDLPVLDPAERTIPTGVLEAAAAYAEQQDSMALIVVRDGKVEFERYWQGAGRDSRFNPQSMSKTVLALLVGKAIETGHIASVHDPVARFVRELEGDPRGAITLHNLLQMSGGLAQITTSYVVSPDNSGVRQHFGTDFTGTMLELPLARPPGTKWDYNNNESGLLGLALTRATGRAYPDYLSAQLWQPLGLADAAMYQDRPGGDVMVSCCIFSRPMDWARIGMLIRDGGRWQGAQLVPADWIAAMATPAQTWAGYGYQVWLGTRNVQAVRPAEARDPNYSMQTEAYVDPEIIVLSGHGFQRVWVMPSRGLVIVRAGRVWPQNWDESVIPNLIARAVAPSVRP